MSRKQRKMNEHHLYLLLTVTYPKPNKLLTEPKFAQRHKKKYAIKNIFVLEKLTIYLVEL
jgi:hypothetical protein